MSSDPITYTVICEVCHEKMLVDNEDFKVGQEAGGTYRHMSCTDAENMVPSFDYKYIAELVFSRQPTSSDSERELLFRVSVSKSGNNLSEVLDKLFVDLNGKTDILLPVIMNSDVELPSEEPTISDK